MVCYRAVRFLREIDSSANLYKLIPTLARMCMHIYWGVADRVTKYPKMTTKYAKSVRVRAVSTENPIIRIKSETFTALLLFPAYPVRDVCRESLYLGSTRAMYHANICAKLVINIHIQ